jgi:hypothetical protein
VESCDAHLDRPHHLDMRAVVSDMGYANKETYVVGGVVCGWSLEGMDRPLSHNML